MTVSTVIHRLGCGSDPVACDEPKCWRMAKWVFVKREKGKPMPTTTNRCDEHAVPIAKKYKVEVPA